MPFVKTCLTLVGALIGAATLTGCEFGNKNVMSLTGYDTISGYYASQPQTLSFFAQIGTGAVRTPTGTVNQLPDFIKAVMGNPTMLFFDDPITGAGSLRSHSETSLGFPTKIQDKAGLFGASSSAYADVSGCRFQQEIDHTGSFTQGATPTSVPSITARGKISLDYTIRYTLIGDDADCDVMRAAFKTCYIDGLNCSSSASSIFYRAFIEEVFDPLINAGVMTDAEIGSARSVGYHVTYQ